jgi:hypothetical protein
MATTIAALIVQVRAHLNEPTASFWTDAELTSILHNGVRDLWRAINDNFQNYFLTIDATNVSMAAGATTLTGVPADVSIVRLIEPRSLTSYPFVKFLHRPYDHPDFQAARAAGTFDPSQLGTIYFDISDAGAPVAAPTIRVAPSISAALLLTLGYVPTLKYSGVGAFTDNPVPGESDQALVNWGVAYARAKEREDRSPDPAWVQMYSAEKQNILTSLTPRQTQDETVAEGMFEDSW